MQMRVWERRGGVIIHGLSVGENSQEKHCWLAMDHGSSFIAVKTKSKADGCAEHGTWHLFGRSQGTTREGGGGSRWTGGALIDKTGWVTEITPREHEIYD